MFAFVLAGVTAVAVAQTFSCTQQASTASAPAETRTYMWGNNFYGQLGFAENNTVDPKFTYIGSQTTTRNTKCVGGFMATAAILGSPTDAVYFSGDSTSGQLGFGPAYETAMRRFYPPVESLPWLAASGSVLEPFSQKVIDVCQGWSHTCVLLQGRTAATSSLGKVMCAGKNNVGQLGVGSFVSDKFSRFSPVLALARDARQERTDTSFNNTVNFKSVHCGADHTFAVTADGTQLWGWGSNSLGQLGRGAEVTVPLAVQISLPGRSAGDKIRHVAAGFAFTVVVMDTGAVYVMGSNAEQQLGIASTTAKFTTPQRATGTLASLGSSIRLIAAGGHHVVMVAGSSAVNSVLGRVYTFGEGTLGQLGLSVPAGKTGQRWYIGTPTPVPALENVAVQRVAAGMKHTVMLDTCGKLYAWGSDAFGQLGLGGSTATQNFRRMTPTLVSKVTQWNLAVYDVCAGAFHTGLIATGP
eukprot:TRINITY_DN21013_c0_g1_i1.p1 TRINITY_DN21013_c0_g1~~TRINITY_DN21013_c0_g1_i1.p1  ORF type:complete len:469 (+),score=88.81 TRINITY_DN21013_c0_g1_i1:130-1536(+)